MKGGRFVWIGIKEEASALVTATPGWLPGILYI